MKVSVRAGLCIAMTLAGLALALPAAAAEEGESGPPSDPGPSYMPAATSVYGLFFTYPNGNVLQGGINDTQSYTIGGGAGTPYTGQLLNFGNPNSNAQLQATFAPVASAYASATQSSAYGRSDGNVTLGYRVVLTAADAQAASNISALLGTSGAIATVSGSYLLSASGYGYSAMSASTGSSLVGLGNGLGGIASAGCGAYGVVSTSSTAGCHGGSFNIPLNFVAGSSFADGDPLSFVGTIALTASANAGLACACFNGGYAGMASAFVDPKVTLASGVRGTLVLGDGTVSNVTPVPEPSEWALLVAGLLGISVQVRRQRSKSKA